MKQGLYAIHDDAAAIFLPPDLATFDEVAIRNFDFAMQKNEMMNFRPADFSLWYVGTFDTETGVMEKCDPRKIKQGSKKGK